MAEAELSQKIVELGGGYNGYGRGIVRIGEEMTATAGRKLKAPFPAFGGKSRVAGLVWPRLSPEHNPARNYIEPFCFSAAMLLLRKDEPAIETINDSNAFVANFWRAIQADPEAVAAHADWPVNETDLHARHAWLVRSHEATAKLEHVRSDPDYFDARIAGWWCWGACMWIGSGWCEQIPHVSNAGQGVLSQQIPHVEDTPGKRPQLCNGNTAHGQGVHKDPELQSGRGMLPQKLPELQSGRGMLPQKLPELQSAAGDAAELQGSRGVLSQQIPELQGEAGRAEPALHQKRPVFPDGSMEGGGVQGGAVDWKQRVNLDSHERGAAGRPQLADAYSRGRGVNSNDSLTDCQRRRLWLVNWFSALSDRLRPVRVCCGHWMRVCDSDSTLTRLGATAVFLDPPYRKKLADGSANRADHIYANDKSQDVDALCDEVQAWCLKYGPQKDIRIALCGLEGEYPAIDKAGWDKVAWKSQGGYGNRNKDNLNAARERIWFSPNCALPAQRHLFTESA